MIERPINFDRLRHMRCGTCAHEWDVDTAWLDRFDQGDEHCPNCGTDCTSENRPNFWVTPDDPTHDDDTVRNLYWYHSSTHRIWPDRNFDPTAQLDDATKQRMEMDGLLPGAVERWAARQKTKALHVGTYEAAIANMLRRMSKQSNATDQFYLHRIQLDPDCIIEPDIHHEPTNFVGDAQLAAVCAPGVTVYRYVNVHEDQSSVSLAITIDAVHQVQTTPIPLPFAADDPQVRDTLERLRAAAARPAEPADPDDGDRPSWKRRQQPPTPLASEAHNLASEVEATLPPALRREHFKPGFDEPGFRTDPAAYPAKLVGLARLATDPQAVLDELNKQPWRPA